MGKVPTTISHSTPDICTEFAISCRNSEQELRKALIKVEGLFELFRALSDDTRTKILYLLSQQELCVCDLAYLLKMTLPAISHHLRLLKTIRLVRSRRQGKQVFYSLDDDHIVTLIRVAREHYSERR